MLTDSLTLLSSASKYDTQLVTRENTKRHNERERESERDYLQVFSWQSLNEEGRLEV